MSNQAKGRSDVRAVTRHLILSILLDELPNQQAILDFGIASQEHYEALYHPYRNQEISPKDLDDALGNGEKLTALVRAAASNPHKDIEFNPELPITFGRMSSQTNHDLSAKEIKKDREMER